MCCCSWRDKLFSTQSVIIIPLKVTVPYRCSTVDGLLAISKSWNKQNANVWQQFNNCGQLLRKFSFHLIAHNEIMRYWDKDDNFSEYTYQNPYFDCQVGSAWRHNAVSGKICHDPRGALMKRISPASIENVWHFGNRFSHDIDTVIYIFILAKKKKKNPSMTESLKSFFLKSHISWKGRDFHHGRVLRESSRGESLCSSCSPEGGVQIRKVKQNPRRVTFDAHWRSRAVHGEKCTILQGCCRLCRS